MSQPVPEVLLTGIGNDEIALDVTKVLRYVCVRLYWFKYYARVLENILKDGFCYVWLG